MSQASWRRWLPRSDRWRQTWRLPVIVATLLAIVYYTAFTYFQTPFYGFVTAWQPDNVLMVAEIPQGRQAAAYLQTGDRIVAIDGVPARQRLWPPLFEPGQSEYTYTVVRDRVQQAFTIPVEPGTGPIIAEVVQYRSAVGLVALAFWLVGTLAILFAMPDNHDAWLLGAVTLGTAVVLAASEAALYNAPGALLLTNPVFPLLGVFLARLAFLPQEGRSQGNLCLLFRGLYGLAVLSGLVALFELFYLNPRGSSFELETGVSLYGILLLALALGAVTNIVVLLVRYARMPRSYLRQQTLIVLLFTVLAVVPGQVLTFYPWLLFDSPILSWVLSNLMLTFVPLGYAFVIFRRNYLQLDVFMTNTLTFLLVVGLLSVTYSAANHVLRGNQFLQSEILPPGLIVVPLLLAAPYVSWPARRAVQAVLYGRQDMQRQRLAAFTATLSANPQPANLEEVVRQTMALLQIRQGVLLLDDAQGMLVPAFNVRAGELQPIAARDVRLLTETRPYQTQNCDLSRVHPALGGLQWLHSVLPLAAQGQLVGLLLLGRPIPDGYLNGQESAFLRQMADTMAVAALNMQLFEATRAMARKLLRVADAERLKLASQIHDDPLQRVSWVASELQRLAAKRTGDESVELQRHSLELLSVAAQLRATSSGLYSPLRQQGVQWAARDLTQAFRSQSDCEVHLNIELSNDDMVATDVATPIYHILRESLNNVRKHAGARNVWVRLYESDGRLCLLIEDDGRAGDGAFMSVPDLLRSHHFGLAGMHEWAGMAGGTLALQRAESGGTRVQLTIPPPWREA